MMTHVGTARFHGSATPLPQIRRGCVSAQYEKQQPNFAWWSN